MCSACSEAHRISYQSTGTRRRAKASKGTACCCWCSGTSTARRVGWASRAGSCAIARSGQKASGTGHICGPRTGLVGSDASGAWASGRRVALRTSDTCLPEAGSTTVSRTAAPTAASRAAMALPARAAPRRSLTTQHAPHVAATASRSTAGTRGSSRPTAPSAPSG